MDIREMTVEEIFARCNDLDVDVNVFRHVESYMKKAPWTAQMKVTADGSTVECRTTGRTGEDAVKDCWAKFEKTVKKGLPLALLSPPIEASASPSSVED